MHIFEATRFRWLTRLHNYILIFFFIRLFSVYSFVKEDIYLTTIDIKSDVATILPIACKTKIQSCHPLKFLAVKIISFA